MPRWNRVWPRRFRSPFRGALISGRFAVRQAAIMSLPETIEWRSDAEPVAYRDALEAMTARNAAIHEGAERELIWLLEHPPVYTAGTSAAAAELLDPRFEVVAAGRGGRYTYHGPGQRVAYALLDLNKRARD